MRKYCIIVAGGTGKRMKSAVPKQFMLLDGRPVLMHTVERFRLFDPEMAITVVLPATVRREWNDLVEHYRFDVIHDVVDGGEERFHSVRAGLEKVPDGVLVAIHDGVRPLVSNDTIWRCFADAEEHGSAIPCLEPSDSVRLTDTDGSRPFPRNSVRLVQTPQVFSSTLIRKAYEREYRPEFTDDASVAEAAGLTVHLTHGNRENIKITNPEDLAIAGVLMKMTGK